MRAFSKMPVPILVLEASGGIMLVLSYLTLHQMLPLPASFSAPLAATVMLFAGIALMLPAAIVMMWRTAKVMAPELFYLRKRTPGDKHDADH
ncbi:YbjC family protein [Pantoea sp. CCBC3-3-1]|uniref:YbjC family protein n=2 Tax=unclassified Pantoea TaxID=2630326 RepID=UPI0011BFB979|nr:YbjC family protein [Pantoea sp. CCBC3-3-1]